jgi:hypothetical protein
MTIVNQYHGCEIASSHDARRHALRRNGDNCGEFETLAAAIHAARRLNDERIAPIEPAAARDTELPCCHDDPELPSTD